MKAKIVAMRQPRAKGEDQGYMHFKGLLDGNVAFYQKVIKTKKDDDLLYISIIK